MWEAAFTSDGNLRVQLKSYPYTAISIGKYDPDYPFFVIHGTAANFLDKNVQYVWNILKSFGG